MTKKFKECFIHIGTPKTGTTTLQEFFFKNKENLSKKGILFPDSFGEKNHIELFICIYDLKKKKHNAHFTWGVTNHELQKDFISKIKNSFKQEIKNSVCTKLLISSEIFTWPHIDENDIYSLKEFLDDFVEKYKIIVYLRPQHEFSISEFNTTLQW